MATDITTELDIKLKSKSKMETENTTADSPPVLNISGRDPNYRRAPRSKKKNKNKAKDLSPPSNKFDAYRFPSLLGRIMLKSNNAIFGTTYKDKYLGTLCLVNNKTNARVYHMFPTNGEDIGKDYDRANEIYRNSKEFTVKNNITVYTICALSLARRVQNSFTDYKWNKEGNIFEAPPGTDEWIMSGKLHALHRLEVLKLINFLKFLMQK